MTAKELSEQLVLAVKEQDVSSVLHTLAKMKEDDCLEQVINNKREPALPFYRLNELLLT